MGESLVIAAVASLGLGVPLLRTLRSSRLLALEIQRLQVTDELTGLPNRQALIEALASLRASRGGWELTIVRLDGLGAYSDAFGPEAGDLLLRRLAQRLESICEPAGRAYRLTGARLAALLPGAAAGPGPDQLAGRLREVGDGFAIEPAVGHAKVRHDAEAPDAALALADRQLLTQGEGLELPGVVLEASRRARRSSENQRDLLSLTCRRLEVDEHVAAVASLAVALRPLGKLSIPHSILHKPSALTGDEWTFVERHAEAGQRIVELTLGLGEVAAAVRSSFERWDGSGYPDGLRGADIPLEARLAAVAGTYEALLAPTAYRAALTPRQAMAELSRCSGTQFDPDVVDAYSACLLVPA